MPLTFPCVICIRVTSTLAFAIGSTRSHAYYQLAHSTAYSCSSRVFSLWFLRCPLASPLRGYLVLPSSFELVLISGCLPVLSSFCPAHLSRCSRNALHSRCLCTCPWCVELRNGLEMQSLCKLVPLLRTNFYTVLLIRRRTRHDISDVKRVTTWLLPQIWPLTNYTLMPRSCCPLHLADCEHTPQIEAYTLPYT